MLFSLEKEQREKDDQVNSALEMALMGKSSNRTTAEIMRERIKSGEKRVKTTVDKSMGNGEEEEEEGDEESLQSNGASDHSSDIHDQFAFNLIDKIEERKERKMKVDGDTMGVMSVQDVLLKTMGVGEEIQSSTYGSKPTPFAITFKPKQHHNPENKKIKTLVKDPSFTSCTTTSIDESSYHGVEDPPLFAPSCSLRDSYSRKSRMDGRFTGRRRRPMATSTPRPSTKDWSVFTSTSDRFSESGLRMGREEHVDHEDEIDVKKYKTVAIDRPRYNSNCFLASSREPTVIEGSNLHQDIQRIRDSDFLISP